jgi:hypothetical protein
MSDLSDFIVKILRGLNAYAVFGAAAVFPGLVSEAARAEVSGRYYWHRDSFLRADPSDDSSLKTWVPAGAYVDIQSCDESGWCYGRAFGVSEGWVPFKELRRNPMPPPRNEGFFGGDLPQERVYHLEDRRKFYGIFGNDLFWGRSSLKISSGENIDRVQSWALFVGAGRRLQTFDIYRWDLEFGMGHLSEFRQSFDLGSSAQINSNNFYFFLGTKLLRPENEYFGFGGFFDMRLRLGGPGLEDNLNKNLSPLLLCFGPLITHGVGSDDRIKWMAWKLSIAFNFSEVFAGLGLNLNL